MAALQPSREIAIPFHFGPDGAVATVDNAVDAAAQRIRSVVLTQPRERVMLPQYGLNSLAAVFEVDDPIFEAEFASEVQLALARWEATVRIVSVQAVPHAENDGVLEIQITYTIPPLPSLYSSVVSLGGSFGNEQGF